LEGPWTSYNASLGRPLLDPRKFEQGEKTPAAKAESASEEPEPVAPAAPSTPEAGNTPATTIDLFSEQKA
jgi:hypothetical protein